MEIYLILNNIYNNKERISFALTVCNFLKLEVELKGFKRSCKMLCESHLHIKLHFKYIMSLFGILWRSDKCKEYSAI